MIIRLAIDIILFLGLVAALYTDLKVGKIDNRLTFGIMGIGILLNIVAGEGVFFGIKGLVIPILVFGLPFALGWFGAGDVKLLAAVGALKGPEFIIYTTLATAIVGGIMAVANLIKRRLFLERCKELFLGFILRTYIPVKIKEASKEEIMPYSIAIFIGTVFTYSVFTYFGWVGISFFPSP